MKKKVNICLLALSALLLTSCTINSGSSSSATNSSSSVSSSQSVSSSVVTPSDNPSGKVPNAIANQSDMQNVFTASQYQYVMPSKGHAKTLVVPVSFIDTRSSVSKSMGRDGLKDYIEDAFFGSREEGEFDSLTTFYQKSSYGALTIEGTVLDWVSSTKTYSSMQKLSEEKFIAELDKFIDKALNAYAKNNNIDDLDSDGDGYIDSIWLICDADCDDNNFWPFTYWSSLETEYGSGLYTGVYSIMTADMLKEQDMGDIPDTHTLIHETGHMLGLDDYYDYDATAKNTSCPAGGLDMMDYNIGDHNAYSKYALDWVKPQRVAQSKTITLTPFEEDGQCAIITAPGYNGTSLWEYYILEYYTPTGLNKHDADIELYDGVAMYTVPGLRIYHADARIGKINYETEKWDNKFITDLSKVEYDDDYIYAPLASNTPSYRYGSYNYNLLELVSATNFNLKRLGANKDLFIKGSSLDAKTRKWNDGTAMNFSLTVTDLTSSQIKIDIQFA